jgi:ABC-type lipoprotein release transport system permease subunit
MNASRLILKEIAHRKINFAMGVVAVSTAVALFVTFMTSGQAYRRETRRIMRDMGQNLRIIPKETPMDEFWTRGFSSHTMPEEYVYRFSNLKGYSYTHLVATLQKSVEWKGRTVILTGLLPEVLPLDKRQQSPMTFSVKPGDAYVGYQVASVSRIKEGEKIDIFDNPFTVKKVLFETGSKDDIRIYGHLHDIQKVLDLPCQINEIKALECLCLIESSDKDIDPRLLAQKQLAEILPEGKVIILQGIAKIREKQRAAMEGYLAFIMPIILVVCGAWIAVLAMMNVRDRRQEIGIIRALGHNSSKIAVLFLGKSVLIGLVGAFIGYFAGTALALKYGPEIFKITAKAIKPEYSLMTWAVIVAPVFAAIASFIPVTIAVAEDPAETLREG